MSLFVSYTRADEGLVRTIRDDLERLGRSVWMDHQIHGGESWWREIIQEIQGAEIFVFALSNHSWRSKPCRLELRYAEKLGIPVLPLQVGPLDSMFISLAEKQIIDYRDRTADAVVRLVTALTELTARPVVLPDPLPAPPEVPFEYLYRIAGLLGPERITPEAQDQLISQLRSKLKEEDDEVARADIVKLFKEVAGRGELTVQNSREIEEILAGVVARSVPAPDDGATRLPPPDHRPTPVAESDVDITEPEPVEVVAVESAELAPGKRVGEPAEVAAPVVVVQEPAEVAAVESAEAAPGKLAREKPAVVAEPAAVVPESAVGSAVPAPGKSVAEESAEVAASAAVVPEPAVESAELAPGKPVVEESAEVAESVDKAGEAADTTAGKAVGTATVPGWLRDIVQSGGGKATETRPDPKPSSGWWSRQEGQAPDRPAAGQYRMSNPRPPGDQPTEQSTQPAWQRAAAAGQSAQAGPAAWPRAESVGHPEHPGQPQGGQRGQAAGQQDGQRGQAGGQPDGQRAEAAGRARVADPVRPGHATPAAPGAKPRFAVLGGVLGALGLPFLILGLAAATSPAIATSLLFVTVLGLSLTLVSATRREPGFRPAIVIAAAGLLGAVVYALGAFGAF